MEERAAGVPRSTFAILFLSVAAMSWAAPLIRFTDAPPLVISFWRLAFSLPLIAVLLITRGELGALARMRVRDWIVALVATQPVWVALFGMVALREAPAPRQWVGIGIAVTGAAVIGWGDRGGGADPLLGDMLALTGAIFVAAYYVIGRRLRQGIGLWPYVAVVYGFATLTLFVALLVSGDPIVETYARRDWLVFLGLAVGPMMIGHTGQNWALRYLPAYTVNLTLLGEPVGATLIAWRLPAIAESPPFLTLAGGMLILSGIVVGMRRR
jgi:drug/metabolite transporter (DMT)-like permease